jgi:protein-disulfide isomerase
MKILALLLIPVLLGEAAPAPLPECDSLTGPGRELARRIMAESYCYDCCDQTIEKCLRQSPRCKLAVRLGRDICQKVAEGKSREEITGELSRRAKSMIPSLKTAAIEAGGINTWAGDPGSRVTLVGYLCARCPFCSKITPGIYREVTAGKLKGRVKLLVRPFPIKGHPGSVEGALAMAAAARLGKFWPYLEKLYRNYDVFSPDQLAPWAEETGLPGREFREMMDSPEMIQLVTGSKKEGLKNGVDATPTFFINGKRYYSDYRIDYMVDVLEEEHDRVTGDIYE